METTRTDYTLFTPGPVMVDAATRELGGRQMEYHRTSAFSRTILSVECLLKQACGADDEARAMLLTASGTAAMEATILNLFAPAEKLAVIDAGDFGARFADIAQLHGHEVCRLVLERGQSVRVGQLDELRGAAGGGLLVNHHETTTGALHDLGLLSEFCRRHRLLFVVDAIGSFLAEPIEMRKLGIDALIVSTQKGWGAPPGLSFVVLSSVALQRLARLPPRSYYFDFRKYAADIVRGQTPFTPAVGLVKQAEARLAHVVRHGVAETIHRTQALALDFRRRIQGLPFRMFAESPAHAVTALEPCDGATPKYYVDELLTRHGLVVCPNGGKLGQRIFRVGHLGDLTESDNTRLQRGLADLAAIRVKQTGTPKT